MVVILDRQLREEIDSEVHGVCSNCKAPRNWCVCAEEFRQAQADELNDYVNR